MDILHCIVYFTSMSHLHTLGCTFTFCSTFFSALQPNASQQCELAKFTSLALAFVECQGNITDLGGVGPHSLFTPNPVHTRMISYCTLNCIITDSLHSGTEGMWRQVNGTAALPLVLQYDQMHQNTWYNVVQGVTTNPSPPFSIHICTLLKACGLNRLRTFKIEGFWMTLTT